MELNTETENKILEAAEKVFHRKGKAGASMQDIAEEAGITRTSLNYYFRSKDMLFESVFREALGKFVPSIIGMLNADLPIREYLPKMVDTIIDTMIGNPQIPIFVLQELSSNPNRMPAILLELGIDPNITLRVVADSGELDDLKIDPRQLMMNVLSLCIFPFAARSVVETILFNGDETAYIEAMKQRKVIIPAMIESMLNIK